ncbi:hypothetical protein [Thiocystis minor]|uniref:hypothetical protein n=1 Tax=Thiocystis minor TaxID=61597 RepID=UPI001F5C76EB|nr:hypothetical protein [Thiocystis minor]
MQKPHAVREDDFPIVQRITKLLAAFREQTIDFLIQFLLGRSQAFQNLLDHGSGHRLPLRLRIEIHIPGEDMAWPIAGARAGSVHQIARDEGMPEWYVFGRMLGKA